MLRGIFLDRDGTINEDRVYVAKIEDFVYIPRSVEALQILTRANIKIHIVTNQAGIAKGLYTEDDFFKLTDWMRADLISQGVCIQDVLYCPHHPDGVLEKYTRDCDCRKPGTALLQKVIEREGYATDEIVMVGDKEIDILTGKALGIFSVLVRTGYGNHFVGKAPANHVADDLYSAVQWLISNL